LEHALNEFITAREMLDAQGKLLEGMADGASLHETATGIALLVEKLVPPALCAIALVRPDGRHMTALAAPSLSHHYFTALDDIEIAPDCGSTGTAAWRRKPVIVADTATDPLWRNLQYFADAVGIRSSWALPILHTDGSALGVLALYYRTPREPGDWDWSALHSCIELIRLALSNERRAKELAASEARSLIATEVAGVGTFDVDLMAGTDTWSPRMRAILGAGDDVPANFESFAALIHPDNRSEFLAQFPDGGRPKQNRLWRTVTRIRRASDGETRIIAITATIIPGSDGLPLHLVGTIFDITDHRRREEELLKAKADAESANRAKSRFLASMSHELRTPLNAIIGFSDMIRSQVFGTMTPARYADYIEDIHRSGSHLLSLINDVLDMAKIEAQKFDLHRSKFPLMRLADGALLLVRPQALAKQLVLDCNLADEQLVLDADERAMKQVLVNLLSNAVKFTQSGGKIRLFAEPLAGGGLALGVEDTGAGMDAEGITTALEPFGQVERDITNERTGTGLGLPLAKALIECHGAKFRIESAIGEGTRIWAEFPPDAVETKRLAG
jgi:PAS domain S-box-containing protein